MKPILNDEDLRRLEVFISRGGDMFNPGVHDGLGVEQFGAEVVNFREYEPTEDSGLNIDPYMTALLGEPWVREFAPGRLRRAMLVVDQRVGMQTVGKLRVAHEVAYALGYALQHQGDLAALHVSGETHPWTEMSSNHNLLDQFERLLVETPGADSSSLAEAMRAIAYNEQHQDMVYIISDLMSSGWQEALSFLADDNYGVTVVQILHPQDISMADNGRFAWQGSLSRITSSSASVRADWSKAAAAYQADVCDVLARSGFQHVIIGPTKPTVRQLIEAFTHQEVYA